MKKFLFSLQFLLLLVPVYASGQGPQQSAAQHKHITEAEAGASGAAAYFLSPGQKARADMLISIFENSSLSLQYGYIEDLHDGRGYTAGRSGFCSGCGDLLLVAERYKRLKPGNPLGKYLPRLRELAGLASDSTAGLDGFSEAWTLAADDKLFRAAQDAVSDDLYYLPALKSARSLGLKKDLSKAALYEAAIQHGIGNDSDGLPALIARASKIVKAPAAGGDERAWLGQFLKIRKATLANASDPGTREAWAESEGRADAMLAIFASGNMDLSGPVTVKPFGLQFTLGRVRDMVTDAVIEQHKRLRLLGHGWSQRQVKEVVRAVIFTQLALRKFSDEADFVRDLKID